MRKFRRQKFPRQKFRRQKFRRMKFRRISKSSRISKFRRKKFRRQNFVVLIRINSVNEKTSFKLFNYLIIKMRS